MIVAISGGADSVALLAVLMELGYDCRAAHCNFHLRGSESMRDMRFVEDIADRLAIDLYIKDFDVDARRRATGESIEMACRELRYEWFYSLLDKNNGQAIAVGHHREDQVETFFLNLLRGTGLNGLCGMSPRNGHVVRPLLAAGRDEIEAYLTEKGLGWIVDSSNLSSDFKRNRLRNELIPALNTLFSGASEAILQTMANLTESRDRYMEDIRNVGARYFTASGEIDLRAFAQAERHAPLLLFELLRGEGFSREQTDNMLRAATRSGGSFVSRGNHARDVDHGILRAPHYSEQPIHGESYPINLRRDIIEPVQIRVTRQHISQFSPGKDPHRLYIDIRALDGEHQWRLRHWQRGDRIRPFGKSGTKLVSDIFANAKLSAEQKASAWILTRDEEILWIVGLRASDLFTVGPSTKEYLQLTYIK